MLKKELLIQSHDAMGFEKLTLEIFKTQAVHNKVYKNYLKLLNCDINKVSHSHQIPFLPISFFKHQKVLKDDMEPEQIFESSGTSGFEKSKHYVASLSWYQASFLKGFQEVFGAVSQYHILGLLPSYLEQGNSSLVYMVDALIKASKSPHSGFYLHQTDELIEKLYFLEANKQKTLLIGVSYALLDLLEVQNFQFKYIKILETGGMKGRRKEMLKKELHDALKKGFGVSRIYSEYGMTELLSQAYSVGNELYKPSPWMRVMIREVEDPFSYLPNNKTGGINVIDFANIYSCSFIETQDLGKNYADGTFEILGRFDHSDIRGCNLMID